MEWGVVHFQAGSGFSVGLFIYFCLRPSRDLPPTRPSSALLLRRYIPSRPLPSLVHPFFLFIFVIVSFSVLSPRFPVPPVVFGAGAPLSVVFSRPPPLDPFPLGRRSPLARSASLYPATAFEACAERPGSGNLIY